MRQLILGGTLVLASVLAQPAMADWKYQFNSDDSLSWRIAGHALKLHSDNTTGITVTKIGADPVWGLQQGDVIVAVDDYPVKHVSQLMDRLRAGSPSSVKLIIDDNPGVGEALALALSLRDIRPLVALGPEQGLALLERERSTS
jgi:C-terminal processing protease CtpA/Prc